MRQLNSGLFFLIFSAGLMFYSVDGSTKTTTLPPACRTHCKVAFGKVLGVGTGHVPAYSNCNASCIDPVAVKKHGTYTGIKWQCVEYARRWLLVNRGEVYGDVDIAADIWKIPFVTRVKDGKKFRMVRYANGSRIMPVVGDLLIYAKAYLNVGHVAVISAVQPHAHTIHVLEQNYRNTRWPGKYARSIHYIKRNGHFWILDPYLLGWKHITRQPYRTGQK